MLFRLTNADIVDALIFQMKMTVYREQVEQEKLRYPAKTRQEDSVVK